jgi:rhodanese-related sulfurtransferase
VPTPIDRDEVQRLQRDEDAQLVEVLGPDGFEDEHLPGAVNIPLRALDRASAAALDASRPVIVYCYDSQ